MAAHAATGRAVIHMRKPASRRRDFLETLKPWLREQHEKAIEWDERERDFERRVEAGDRKALRKLMLYAAFSVFGGLAATETVGYIIGGLRFGWF